MHCITALQRIKFLGGRIGGVKRMVLKQFVEINEKKPLFQLFFLKDNEDLGVEIDEVKKIDFEMVVRRLNRGESVFIVQKKPQERNLNQSVFGAKKQWYFTNT